MRLVGVSYDKGSSMRSVKLSPELVQVLNCFVGVDSCSTIYLLSVTSLQMVVHLDRQQVIKTSQGLLVNSLQGHQVRVSQACRQFACAWLASLMAY